MSTCRRRMPGRPSLPRACRLISPMPCSNYSPSGAAARKPGSGPTPRRCSGESQHRSTILQDAMPRCSGAKRRRRRSDIPARRVPKERPMKHFMIKYQFANGTTEDWHREIARFIAALDGDPELKGKISYRCMKNRDDTSYYHLAAAADEHAIKTLQARDFFKHYTEKTRQVAGGDGVVTPVELIAETAH